MRACGDVYGKVTEVTEECPYGGMTLRRNDPDAERRDIQFLRNFFPELSGASFYINIENCQIYITNMTERTRVR